MDIIQLRDGETPRRLGIDADTIEEAKSALTNGYPEVLMDLGVVHHAAAPVTIVGIPVMEFARVLDIPFDAVNAFANSIVADGDGYSLTDQLLPAEDVAYALMTNTEGKLIDWSTTGAGIN